MTDDGVLFAGILEMSTATENSIRFSGHTLDKATKAKVTLENYYSNLISQHVERKQRYPPAHTFIGILKLSDFYYIHNLSSSFHNSLEIKITYLLSYVCTKFPNFNTVVEFIYHNKLPTPNITNCEIWLIEKEEV